MFFFRQKIKGGKLMNDMEKMLIHRCKKGDLTAYEILISNHEKKVFNIVYSLVGNVEDAKDIAQDTFIKAYRKIVSFREESSFSTWIYRIAVNASKDFLKKDRNTLSLNELKSEPRSKNIHDPQEQYERFEEGQQIIELLENLKEEYKNVIVLRDIQGFSYEEIAKILNINLGTVKSRINRGRGQLRDLLMGKKDYI